MRKEIAALHYILCDVPGRPHTELAEAACAGGVRWIQLRLKNKPPEEMLAIAKQVQSVCRKNSATLLVNDYVEIAARIGADGVHLGKLDMAPSEARKMLGDEAIIGATTNSVEDVGRVEVRPARSRTREPRPGLDSNGPGLDPAGRGLKPLVDYIGLGPFRFTTTKEKLSPVLGLEGIKRVSASTSLPVIAVGGIELGDVEALMAAGISGIAVASAIGNARDVTRAAQEFVRAVENSRKESCKH